MKKRVLSVLVAILAICVFAFTLTGCGKQPVEEQPASEGLEYTLNEDGESYCLIGIGTCTDTDIVIPNTYNGKPVTSIGYWAFPECRDDFGMEGPNNIRSITIPDSVTSIAGGVFNYCDSLQYNEYDNAKYLGNKDNPYLWLIEATSDDITSCTINENCKFIYHFAFGDCSSLMSIVIPDGVTSIGDYAFRDCSSLTSVTIGGGITNIGGNAFDACDSLASITVDENNATYSSIDGNLYSKDGTELVQYAIGKTATEFIIPDSVTNIGERAFCNCNSLTSIVISDSVTSIGDDAFCNCNSLTSITIGNSVTSIGEYAFAWCDKLTNVTIPDGVTSIGDGAFYSCDSLVCVVVPDSVTSIGEKAFWYCKSLTSVTIGSGVKSIGSEAFAACDELENITVDENNTAYCSIDGNLYSKDGTELIQCAIGKTTTEFIIPDSVTSIGEHAFSGCDSLTGIIIPNSVTSIGRWAFSSCDSLQYNEYDNAKYLGNKDNPYLVLITATSTDITSCTINENCKFIYHFAFGYCRKLTSIVIPDSVTNIGYEAFHDCSNLTNVKIGNSVTNIGDYVFFYCSSLTSITIPDSVTSIGDYAFWNCSSLTSITIPDSVTSIGDYAFSDCSSLTSITIPDSVTSIGDRAFFFCDLTSIIIPGSVTSIGEWAFDGCSSLTSVYYTGLEEDWNKISIDNENYCLRNATRYYYSESQPTEDGNYWHYVDGEPKAW